MPPPVSLVFSSGERRRKDSVDGGVLGKILVIAPEKMEADFIIPISSDSLSLREPSKVIEVLLRMNEVREWEFARIESLLAGFLFFPFG